jgi:CheY-like chemotaxis protein
VPQKAKILIVDDELAVRILLTRWLQDWGYHVTSAASALDALQLMTAEPRDIVLCDVVMPDHDGFWLAARLLTRWPETALVMVTGYDDAETVRESRRVGAVDFVSKPFDEALLRQALDRASGLAQFRSSAITSPS